MKILLNLLLVSFFCIATISSAHAQNVTAPDWLWRDIARKAAWLSSDIKNDGLYPTVIKRWNAMPVEAQNALIAIQIPQWMIGLIPADAGSNDTYAHFQDIANLAGSPSASPIANRAEQLLLFAGAAYLPTPGDNATGVSLGAEGCTAAMSKYIFAQLKQEFSTELASMPFSLTSLQSSEEMEKELLAAYRSGASWLQIADVPFASLTRAKVSPGSFMIAQKPGGTHTFGWARVPSDWNWPEHDLMAIGNTGLPQFGREVRLAQEYIADSPYDRTVTSAGPINDHGPINSRDEVFANGQVDLNSNSTNVYFAKHADFIIINFR